MLEPFDAAATIVAAIHALPAVDVPLTGCDGLVLARDVISPVALPLWANSAMDGYACRTDDVARASADAPVTLRVVDDVRAGAFPQRPIGPGLATRIATGAPVPDGADCVVRVEDTDGGTEVVRIRDARDAGRNVRPRGEDVGQNTVALAQGTLLGPAQISLLASVGAAWVPVHRKPRVGIVTTGDELVPVERFNEVLAGERIVSSNSYGLAAQVRSAGGEPVDFGIVPDDERAVREAIERASACDLIITSAGVSVGEADYIRRAVETLRGKLEFWRVRMRPGAPLAFGSVRGKPWIGLPGNPVSSFVTFELFARPAIRALLGAPHAAPRRVQVVAADAYAVSVPLTHFLRVTLEAAAHGPPRARLAGPQASNIMSSLARADALLIVPADHGDMREGDVLDAILI
ncbi:MAG TPA: gephyrin-like molybdotransferase Glp [Gemmatimonadaceae bacterium]|nr:gephyrin-like molybdotransferase Glp [Gemmatimonadaceae bacterium]